MSLEAAKERFENANKEMSKHCFEVGRLRFVIELDEEHLEKRKLLYRNMRVDFDRLNKELNKASEQYQAAMKEASKEEKISADILEMTPQVTQ